MGLERQRKMTEQTQPSKWLQDDKGNKSIGRAIAVWAMGLATLMVIAEVIVAIKCSTTSSIFTEWVYISLIGTGGAVKATGKFAEKRKDL